MSDNWLAQEVGADSKKMRQQEVKRRIVIGIIGLIVLGTGGMALAAYHNPKVIKTANDTPIPASEFDTPTPTPGISNLVTPTGTPSLVVLTAPSMSSNYTPPISQSFSLPSISIPSSSGTVSIPSYSYTPPTPAPTCAYGSQITTASQNLLRAENQLSEDEQASQTGAMPDGESGAGVSATQHNAAWASALQSDEATVNSDQNTLSGYEGEPGC